MDVTPFYDPMLAKLIAHGDSRSEALDRAARAIAELDLDGITHNAPLHAAILSDPDFRDGEVHTGLLAAVVERSNSS